MTEEWKVCPYCGKPRNFAGPAILLIEGSPPQYEPDMSDWRGGYVRTADPGCFAEAEGDEAFRSAVEMNERRVRGEL
jgi:hypothetical protein